LVAEDVSFPNFVALFPRLASRSLWRRHYSEAAWSKALVSADFVPPDREKLASALFGASSGNVDAAGNTQVFPRLSALVQAQFPRAYDAEAAVERLFPVAPLDMSHVDLLFLIFYHVWPVPGTRQPKRERPAWARHRPARPAEATVQLSAMLCVLYDANPARQAADGADDGAKPETRQRPDVPTGLTHLYFWISMVASLIAYEQSTGQALHRRAPGDSLQWFGGAFGAMLQAYPVLLWPDLWERYYTLNSMWGASGLEYCLEPDAARIPAFHTMPRCSSPPESQS
jgi:hypothetical protein